MNLKDLQAFHLESTEHMVLRFRKHWFVLFRDSLGTVLAGFLPPLAFLIATKMQITTVPTSMWAFMHFWWFLIVWLALSAIWTNYYLDLWIITDKRIVSIDQSGLFRREVTTLPFANVQDVTVEQAGIIQTLLNFGTLRVQTAGPATNKTAIVGVAKPGKIRDTIVAQTEHWRLRSVHTPGASDGV